MDLLDQLIAQAKKDKENAPARVRGRPPAVDRAERENEYLPYRMVALYNQVICTHCGREQHLFEGLFEERKHTRLGDTHWVKQGTLPFTANLPRVKQFRTCSIPYCDACAELSSYEEQ